MAKRRQPVRAVALTDPSGVRVTVAESAVDKYKRLGYKGVPGRPKAKAAKAEDE